MSYYDNFKDLPVAELVSLYEQSISDEEERADYYCELAYALRRFPTAGVEYLFRKIGDSDLDKQRAAIYGLGIVPRELDGIKALSDQQINNLTEELLKLLNQSDLSEFALVETIDTLRRLSIEDKELVLKFQNHHSPYVRGSIVRYVSGIFPREAPPLLRQGLQDTHYIVRSNAVSEIGNLGLKDLMGDLIALQNDPHPDVREAVEFEIQYLTDETDNDLT